MFVKKALVTLALVLTAFWGLQAQTIRVGDRFYNGYAEYTVQEVRMGTYVYMTDDQDDEITLEKVKGEEGVYKLIPSRQAEEPPFANAEFGYRLKFQYDDGNLILAVLDPDSKKVDFLRPLVARDNYRFVHNFLPAEHNDQIYDRIVVKGQAGTAFAPEFVTELELAQTYDMGDSRLNRLTWVNDQVDLNFDGIPDLLIYQGIGAGRGARSWHFGYVWNPDELCFESILPNGFLDLEIDQQSETLSCTYSNGPDEDFYETYYWRNGKLKLVGAGSLDGEWYNGSLVYSAVTDEGEVVIMSATDEGEELEFTLHPTPEQVDAYLLADGLSGGFNEYKGIAKVVRRASDDLDVLCLYDTDGMLQDVMLLTDEWNNQNLSVDLWLAQIVGTYSLDDGTPVIIRKDKAIIGGKTLPLNVFTFNGYVMDVVEIGKEGSPIKGAFELVPTADGFTAKEMAFSEEFQWYEPTGKEYRLTWNDKNTSRFDFASNVVLNDRLSRYDKKTLRLMRNAILAKHGYVFQSKDLKDYFGAQRWYKPAPNADIELSFIEQLNADLIKAAEKK